MKPDEPSRPSPGPRPLYQNPVSYAGMLIAIGSAALILLVTLVEPFDPTPNPYVGMFTLLLLPGVSLVGVLLILGGMRWEAGRRRKSARLAQLPYPKLDLNDRRQRRLFAVVVVLGVLLGTVVAWGAHEGYEYTESVAFCGTTCHTPMEPEHTAYLDSAHARVACVDCHVGEGAKHYLRSKLQGAHQLWAVLFNDYERPIPTPIANLRPARETCERCHWPAKFFGAKLLQLPHYRYDEQNSAEQITLTLKTGGGSKAHGASGGVHWHMLIDNQVTFAATDAQLQEIPWVRVRHSDGRETTYFSKQARVSRDQIAKLPRHTMDCMDCHNRPAHGFPSPEGGIDEALFKGEISPALPWIKKLLVDALIVDYPNREQAHQSIRKALISTYEAKYPQLLRERRAEIARALDVANYIYDRAVFPEMRVSWHTYPVNIGHRYWPGCFRCHDGQHVSEDGKVIANKCAGTCHTGPRRGPIMALGVEHPDATTDWHPWQLPEKSIRIPAHDKLLCSSCHKAGRGPKSSCDDCHQK